MNYRNDMTIWNFHMNWSTFIKVQGFLFGPKPQAQPNLQEAIPTKCQRPWNAFGIQTFGYLATRDCMDDLVTQRGMGENILSNRHTKRSEEEEDTFFICFFLKLVMPKKSWDVSGGCLKGQKWRKGWTIFHQRVATGWWAQGTAKASWHRFWRLVAMHRKLSNCYSAWCEAWSSYSQWRSGWKWHLEQC